MVTHPVMPKTSRIDETFNAPMAMINKDNDDNGHFSQYLWSLLRQIPDQKKHRAMQNKICNALTLPLRMSNCILM